MSKGQLRAFFILRTVFCLTFEMIPSQFSASLLRTSEAMER